MKKQLIISALLLISLSGFAQKSKNTTATEINVTGVQNYNFYKSPTYTPKILFFSRELSIDESILEPFRKNPKYAVNDSKMLINYQVDLKKLYNQTFNFPYSQMQEKDGDVTTTLVLNLSNNTIYPYYTKKAIGVDVYSYTPVIAMLPEGYIDVQSIKHPVNKAILFNNDVIVIKKANERPQDRFFANEFPTKEEAIRSAQNVYSKLVQDYLEGKTLEIFTQEDLSNIDNYIENKVSQNVFGAYTKKINESFKYLKDVEEMDELDNMAKPLAQIIFDNNFNKENLAKIETAKARYTEIYTKYNTNSEAVCAMAQNITILNMATKNYDACMPYIEKCKSMDPKYFKWSQLIETVNEQKSLKDTLVSWGITQSYTEKNDATANKITSNYSAYITNLYGKLNNWDATITYIDGTTKKGIIGMFPDYLFSKAGMESSRELSNISSNSFSTGYDFSFKEASDTKFHMFGPKNISKIEMDNNSLYAFEKVRQDLTDIKAFFLDITPANSTIKVYKEITGRNYKLVNTDTKEEGVSITTAPTNVQMAMKGTDQNKMANAPKIGGLIGKLDKFGSNLKSLDSKVTFKNIKKVLENCPDAIKLLEDKITNYSLQDVLKAVEIYNNQCKK